MVVVVGWSGKAGVVSERRGGGGRRKKESRERKNKTNLRVRADLPLEDQLRVLARRVVNVALGLEAERRGGHGRLGAELHAAAARAGGGAGRDARDAAREAGVLAVLGGGGVVAGDLDGDLLARVQVELVSNGALGGVRDRSPRLHVGGLDAELLDAAGVLGRGVLPRNHDFCQR